MKKSITAIDQIKPGMQLKVCYDEKNINNRLMHIRAIVDERQFVFCVWSPRKGWIYMVESNFYFELRIRRPGTIVHTGWDKDFKPNSRT